MQNPFALRGNGLQVFTIDLHAYALRGVACAGAEVPVLPAKSSKFANDNVYSPSQGDQNGLG